MSKEAMKLALEALVKALPDMPVHTDWHLEAITALREALAEQPASKPWVGLTDDDKCVKELYESDTDPEWIDGYTTGLKDAENKLRRYNALPAQHRHISYVCPQCHWSLEEQPAQQEPVATVVSESGDPNVSMSWWHEPALPVGAKLYTSPPAQRKPWVGLTNKDIDIAFDDTQEGGGFDDFARAIEAKLKEKNA